MRAAPRNNANVDNSTETVADITLFTSDVDSDVSIYWDSLEVVRLFGFSYKNGENVYESLRDRICLLGEVQRSEDGYKRFITDIEKRILTTKQILLRKKFMYLRTAYTIALDKLVVVYTPCKTWWTNSTNQPSIRAQDI